MFLTELIVKRYFLSDGSAVEGWARGQLSNLPKIIIIPCFAEKLWSLIYLLLVLSIVDHTKPCPFLLSLDGSNSKNGSTFSLHIIISNIHILYLRNNNRKTFLLLHQDTYLLQYILDNDNFISKEKDMTCKGSGLDVKSSVSGFGLFLSSLKKE